MCYKKIGVILDGFTSECSFFTDIPVEVHDRIIVETRYGDCEGSVFAIFVADCECNPFEDNDKGYKATKHVLKNITKNITRTEGDIIMDMLSLNARTVKIQHVASDRTSMCLTDITDLKVGDTVVHEGTDGKMHVGTVVLMADEMNYNAKQWVVAKVDLTAYQARLEREKQLKKLRNKLEAKKRQYQDLELLRLIAANDPETKTLLEQYTAIVNNTTTTEF